MKYHSLALYLEYVASVSLTFTEISVSSWGIWWIQFLKLGTQSSGDTDLTNKYRLLKFASCLTV